MVFAGSYRAGKAMTEAGLFDLNIEKILEPWENAHALGELIANAIDEQQLSGTAGIEVLRAPDGNCIIRDFEPLSSGQVYVAVQ